ncbi:MAG: polymer-forming cytoskeletal protein [Bacteroidota bacterium]|nr:polymer-forming cytoskeletal protein [Bacteroidota bacterium]
MATKSEISNELNLIGTGTIIEGKLRSRGNIRIDGKINGELFASESVSVGSSGEIEGSVSAKNISIGGKVKGSITVQEKLVLENKAIVSGDIRAAKLVIDEGAIFDGNCTMSGSKTLPLQPDTKQ